MKNFGVLCCIVLFLQFANLVNSFEIDFSSIYKLWSSDDKPLSDTSDSLERFKRLVDEKLNKAQNGLMDVHGLDTDTTDENEGHSIQKREIPHNLIRDSLGIQILHALNEIYTVEFPFQKKIISMEIIFCSSKLILAIIFDDGFLKVADISSQGDLLLVEVPIGQLSLVCTDDSLLVVVASASAQHSWAARVCLDCTDPVYTQYLAPYKVVAVHELSNAGKPPTFAFCSSSLVTIMTWKREYFQAPLIIQTHSCSNVQLVSIHSIDYLIVAESGNLEIYRIKPMSYEHVQSIIVANATDIASFSIGGGISTSFYLIVVNRDDHNPQNTKPVIFKWHGDTYLIQQCLNVVEVTDITTISVDNKLIIIVTSAAQGTIFFQFNGFKFVETFQYSSSVMSLPIAVSFAYTPGNSTLYLAGADTHNVAIYTADFFTKNELADWHETALMACEKLKDRVTKDDVNDLVHKVRKSFFINQTEPIEINGNVTFQNLTVTESANTEKVNILSRNETYSHSILHTLRELWAKLLESKEKLKNAQELLDRALKTSGNQTVNATYYFQNISLECHHCNIDTINVDALNGENVTDYRHQVIYTDINETAESLTFTKELTVKHLLIDGWLNGVNTSNFLYNNSKEVITGFKVFLNNVTIHNLTVEGLVDGIKISPDNLLLIHGDQNVTGTLNFVQDITVASLHVRDLVDGIDLDVFYNKTVTTGGDFNITGHPTFKNLILKKDLNVTRGNHVDGVDIFDLNDNAFRIDRNQTITAPYYFENVVFENGITGNFTINGIKFPDDVVLVNEDTVLKNEVTFHETISVEELFVNSSINGIGIVESDDFIGQLDIVVRNIEQTITGHKTFLSDIHLSKDSIVTGFIDGIDLSKFAQTVARKNSTQIIPGVLVVNGSVTFKDTVRVGGEIDGANLTQIFENGVRLNTTILPNFSKLIFEEHIDTKYFNCKDINGIDTTKDLLFKNSTQMIFGNKTFVDSIYITGSAEIDGLVNGVNLTFFEDVLFTHGNQNVTGNKIIVNKDLYIESAYVVGTVDTKFIPDDLIPLNYSGEIHIVTEVYFEHLKINNLFATHITVDNYIDGEDLLELVNTTLTFDGNQTVTGTKYVNELIVTEGSNIQVNSEINGVNITELFEDAVLIYANQTIEGNKTFHGSVSFYNLNFTGLFDHVSDWEFRENWLLQDEDQTIFANLTFENDVNFNNSLHIDGLLNGINLTKLYQETVKLDEETTINGPVHIGNATSLGNVTVTGTVNGLNFSEDVVQIHKNYTITGNKTFSDVLVEKDLNSPIVDYVDIKDLCNNALRTSGDQIINGTLFLNGSLFLEDELIVGGKINGVNLTEFLEKVVTIDGENIMSDSMNITNLTINANVFVNGSVDGIDFDEFIRTYLSISRTQNITGKYTFLKPIEIDYLDVGSISTTDGEVNDVNIEAVNNTVLKIFGDQIITGNYTFTNTVHFKGDLNVSGTVDGLNIPDDVVIIGLNNTIYGRKTFKNLTIWKDLQISEHKTVQGVDVSKWAENAVYFSIQPNGTLYYIINGTKTFLGGLSLGNITVDNLNNLTISEETILLTKGNQTVTAEKIIDANIEFGNITVVHINNVDINDLDNRAVKTDEINNITGKYTFTTIQNFTNIRTEQLVDGVNITRLFKSLEETIDLGPLIAKLNDTEDVIFDLKTAISHQAVLLNYYYKYKKVPGANGFVALANKTYGIQSVDVNGNICHELSYVNDPTDYLRYKKIRATDDEEINELPVLAIAHDDGLTTDCPGYDGSPLSSLVGNFDHIHIIAGSLFLADIATGFNIKEVSVIFIEGSICVAATDVSSFKIFCVDQAYNINEIFSDSITGTIQTSDFYSDGYIVYCAFNIQDEHIFKTIVYTFNISSGNSQVFTEGYYPASALHFVEFKGFVFLAVGKKTTHAGYGAVIIYKIRNNQLEKFQLIYKVEDYFIDPLDIESVFIEDQEMYIIVLSDRIRDNVVLFKYRGAEGFNYHSAVTGRRGERLNVMGRLLGVSAEGEDSKKSMLFASDIRGDIPYY